jgi:malate dehydrogenase (oxaloacetate-decarboxylating)
MGLSSGAFRRDERYANPHSRWPEQTNMLAVEVIKRMVHDPIVFAPANPMPAILLDSAASDVAVMGTSRRDLPNQVNNLLAFPRLFRGALAARAAKRFARAAVMSDERSAEYVIPSVFDSRVVTAVTAAVRDTAIEEGRPRRALLVADDESLLANASK